MPLPPVTAIPDPLLPEIRLRAPVTVPPIVLFWAPIPTWTPSPLAIALFPVASVPIKFPCTTLLVAPEFMILIPASVFPEMMLRAVAMVPPMLLSAAPSMTTPDRFAIAPVPAGLVPMKLPSTWVVPPPKYTLICTPAPASAVPFILFPEITLPAPGALPPTITEPPEISTPVWLVIEAVPEELRPM